MPQRSLGDIKAEQTQLRTRVGQLVDEAREIEIKIDVDGATPGLEERKGNLERAKAKAASRLAELGAEHSAAITRMVESGQTHTEAGINLSNAYTERDTRTDDAPAVEPHRKAALDGALRTLERCQSTDVMPARAAVAMEHVVRHGDPTGSTARYLTAVGDPAYSRAFAKLLQYGTTAGMRMTADEHAAVQRVTQIDEERAMSDGVGASGGFGIPIEIDPTILLSSSGVLNPIRSVAQVRQMASYTLRLVSGATPTATYAGELTEVADGTPTLAQPIITAEKGQAFIPFSVEVEADYQGLAMELGKLLADARDILDATKFLSGAGSGSNEPQGLYTGLSTTQRVQTATSSVTAIGDLYALKEQLNETRFWANATFAANPTVWDVFFRFVGGGNTTEPEPFTNGRGGAFLGTPKIEWSTMETGTTTTGQQTVFVGDFTKYVIADRIGSQIELIPQIFGSASRFPTGQRGLYFWWRTGAAVSVPNAFRYLETK